MSQKCPAIWFRKVIGHPALQKVILDLYVFSEVLEIIYV